MTSEQRYARLSEAVQDEQGVALVRLSATYQPAGGRGARLFPPTYPRTPSDGHPYAIEPRLHAGSERSAVLLDMTQSQANRAEQALLAAHREGRLHVPMLVLSHAGRGNAVITSLDAPHRAFDAYFRDGVLDGTPLDKSDVGRALQTATPSDARGLFSHDPCSLVLGSWNSHRTGRTSKFPRAYASELIGWDPQLGERRAGRMDPLNLVGATDRTDVDWSFVPVGTKVKGSKLSEIGHGNVAPNAQHGGVTVSSAERTATLSLAALRRISFGDASPDATTAARVALAALALAADRLAFGGASLWLRSGCELVVETEQLAWVRRGNTEEPFELTSADAVELYLHARERAAEAGLPMSDSSVQLVPNKALAEAIDFALTKAAATDE